MRFEDREQIPSLSKKSDMPVFPLHIPLLPFPLAASLNLDMPLPYPRLSPALASPLL